MKDIVDAEERNPIRVKGIDRDVRTYAVQGIYDDIDSKRKFIRTERKGMACLLDIDKIPADERDDAISDLTKLIDALKSDS